jgi:eukaryotic-like serine/threonine-protein kinase
MSPLGLDSTLQAADVAASDPRVGRAVGGYVLEALIGRGGMACVYRARHLLLGHRMAIKLVCRDGARSAEACQRLLEEARIAARLPTEHVVAVLDFGWDAELGAFAVMPLLEGGTLAELIAREGPLPEMRAIEIALDICAGLAEAHLIGVVHRDVKPENVWITPGPNPRAKIMDFGIAKNSWSSAARLTRAGQLLGTPLYMSPEQWTSGETDSRTDVYAVGAVLYELLTGQPPIVAGDPWQLAQAAIREQPLPLRRLRPGVSRALAALVLRCLRKNPAERPRDMAALASELRGAHRRPHSVLAHSALALAAATVVSLAGWTVSLERAAEGTLVAVPAAERTEMARAAEPQPFEPLALGAPAPASDATPGQPSTALAASPPRIRSMPATMRPSSGADEYLYKN